MLNFDIHCSSWFGNPLLSMYSRLNSIFRALFSYMVITQLELYFEADTLTRKFLYDSMSIICCYVKVILKSRWRYNIANVIKYYIDVDTISLSRAIFAIKTSPLLLSCILNTVRSILNKKIQQIWVKKI